MSNPNHPWCSDVSRDEAIRAAEDDAANWRRLKVGEVIEHGDEFDDRGTWAPAMFCIGRRCPPRETFRRRRVPLPDHRELPAAVAELRERVGRLEAFTKDCTFREAETANGAANPAADASGGGADGLRDMRVSRNAKADGLRTERVTLEITWDTDGEPWTRLAEWFPAACLAEWFGGRGESVRVVEETHFDDLAKVTAERDAALRERDAARAEVDTYRVGVRTLQGMLVKAEARVAELEASAKLAPAANAGGEQPEPRGWLTKDERKCLTFLLENVCVSRETDACIAALLARSTPPSVKKRGPWTINGVPGDGSQAWKPMIDQILSRRDDEWIAAIREAGIEVE